MRYATEFFSPVYEGRKARKRDEAFLSALESLQEHLGELNDLAVSQEMHPDLVPDHYESRMVEILISAMQGT